MQRLHLGSINKYINQDKHIFMSQCGLAEFHAGHLRSRRDLSGSSCGHFIMMDHGFVEALQILEDTSGFKDPSSQTETAQTPLNS